METCAYVQTGRRGSPSVCGKVATWRATRAYWAGYGLHFYACGAHKGALTRASAAGRMTPSRLLAGVRDDWQRVTPSADAGIRSARARMRRRAARWALGTAPHCAACGIGIPPGVGAYCTPCADARVTRASSPWSRPCDACGAALMNATVHYCRARVTRVTP